MIINNNEELSKWSAKMSLLGSYFVTLSIVKFHTWIEQVREVSFSFSDIVTEDKLD